jgi:hypothetical protein
LSQTHALCKWPFFLEWIVLFIYLFCGSKGGRKGLLLYVTTRLAPDSLSSGKYSSTFGQVEGLVSLYIKCKSQQAAHRVNLQICPYPIINMPSLRRYSFPLAFSSFECGGLGTFGLWTPPNPQLKTTKWQKITTPKRRKLSNCLIVRSRIIYCFVVKTFQLKDSNSIVILVCEKSNNLLFCIQNFPIEGFKFCCESEHDEKNALACSNTCWNAMSQVKKPNSLFCWSAHTLDRWFGVWTKVEWSELLINRLPSLSLYKKLKVSPMGWLVDQASDIHT